MLLTKLIDNNTKLYKCNPQKYTVSGISVNSKYIKKGMIFAAVNGANKKGISFVKEATKKGAYAVLCNKSDIKNIKEKKLSILTSNNIRLSITEIANKFYPKQPNFAVAVTGTNGKTSIVDFLRKIWNKNNIKAASIGTLGIQYGSYTKETNLTTLEPVSLHKELFNLKNKKINYLAIEASSHALNQYRLDKVKLKLAVFTNLSRDHLDYHKNINKYFLSKARLFKFILNKNGIAIINTDNTYGKKLKDLCLNRKLKTLTYGFNSMSDWQILEIKRLKHFTHVKFKNNKRIFEFNCLLFADFEIENLICSMLLANLSGLSIKKILKIVENIKPPKGRLNKVKAIDKDISVYIDYAHTPEALKNSLFAVKNKSKGKGKVFLLFGCGGNRDKGKRRLMAKIANKLADKVFVTDDNPRDENPKAIRLEISSNCKKSCNIGGRKKAIFKAIKLMQKGDFLLIAGKGHEKYQEIKGKLLPFDDEEIAKEAINMRKIL